MRSADLGAEVEQRAKKRMRFLKCMSWSPRGLDGVPSTAQIRAGVRLFLLSRDERRRPGGRATTSRGGCSQESEAARAKWNQLPGAEVSSAFALPGRFTETTMRPLIRSMFLLSLAAAPLAI